MTKSVDTSVTECMSCQFETQEPHIQPTVGKTRQTGLSTCIQSQIAFISFHFAQLKNWKWILPIFLILFNQLKFFQLSQYVPMYRCIGLHIYAGSCTTPFLTWNVCVYEFINVIVCVCVCACVTLCEVWSLCIRKGNSIF